MNTTNITDMTTTDENKTIHNLILASTPTSLAIILALVILLLKKIITHYKNKL